MLKYKNQKYLTFVLSIATFMAVLFVPQHSLAVNTSFSQYIAPLPCEQVEAMFELEGNEGFYTSHGCYEPVQPAVPTPTVPARGAASKPTQPIGDFSWITKITPVDSPDSGWGGGKSVAAPFVDYKNHMGSQNAYLFAAKNGQEVQFRLSGDSPLADNRSLTVEYVDSEKLVIVFEPSGKRVSLSLNETANIDIAFDWQNDLVIRYEANAGSGARVLRLWFLNQQLAPVNGVEETTHAMIATMLVIGAGGFSVYWLHQIGRWLASEAPLRPKRPA